MELGPSFLNEIRWFYYPVQLLESERNYKWPEVHWQHWYHLIHVIKRKIHHVGKQSDCLVVISEFSRNKQSQQS